MRAALVELLGALVGPEAAAEVETNVLAGGGGGGGGAEVPAPATATLGTSAEHVPQPAAPRSAQRRRLLLCPCCGHVFSPGEDDSDVQMHILTACSAPWAQPEVAFARIGFAPPELMPGDTGPRVEPPGGLGTR
jgi:hypothetical protein